MAISTEISWSISRVERDLSDGFITEANWVMTGVAKSDGVGIATVTLDGPPAGFGTVRPDPMIPYVQVSQANVISWSQTAIGLPLIATYTDTISQQLGRIINPPPPTTAAGVPWSE